MNFEERFNGLIRIFLLGKIVGESNILNEWDKVEVFYENLEKKNPKIKELTKSIEDWCSDLLDDELDSGDLINKFFDEKNVKEIIDNKLRPLALEEINRSAIKSINGLNENKIKRFNQYNSINEGIDLYKVNIDKLTNTREGIDLFFKLVKEIGMSVRQTVSDGYQIVANGNHLDLLNHWRDDYGLEYEVEKVSNKEHEEYGKWFYTINIFRDPTKTVDISDWMRKINK